MSRPALVRRPSSRLNKVRCKDQKKQQRAMLFEPLENRSLLATITGNTAIGGFEALNSSSLLYQLSASSLALANGAPVTAWNNSGAAANNFTQADPNKQPTFVSSGSLGNGLPTVSFDGNITGVIGNPAVAPNADELLLSNSTAPATVFIVNSTASNNGLDGIIGQELGDFGIRRQSSTAWQHPGNGNDLSNPGALYVNGVTGINPAAALNAPIVLSATRPTGTAMAPTSLGDYFQVGAIQPRSWGGQIGDLIAFNRALNPAERTVVENSLSAKYGIPLAAGDIYAGDNAVLGDYDRGVFGIGGQLTTNVAIGKTATLSSQGHPTGDAAHGTDGNTNGNYGSNSVTHSNTEANPFLQVDLGDNFAISSIDLWNRTDCCGDRMRDIRVQILNSANVVVWQNASLINPGNSLNGPAKITVDVVALSGGLVTGSKVKVTLEGASETINIAEVQVWATSKYTNVAQGKVTTQSSVAAGGTSDRAVDGNTDGSFGSNSVTHTNAEANPFWRVDLGADTPISQVLLYNRTDCCGDRLSDITVEVLDSSLATVFTASGLNAANVLDNPYLLGVDVQAANGGVPVTGRYVRVTAVGASKILSLAEAMVMTPPTPNGTALSSAGSNGFGLEQTSAAGFNSYLAAGYKQVANSLVTTDLPAGVDKRWDRAYYVDKTGTMSATMAFDFSDAGIASVPASTISYQLLYSPNNNFESANSSFTPLNLTPTVVGDLVTFSVPDATLQDGYYTLGLLDQSATLQAGSGTASDGTADAFRIVRSGAGGVNLDFYQGATLVRSSPYASITSVNVVGSNDNDTFTVDQTGGVIARTMSYAGNGQTSTPGDSLIIFGGAATTVTHTFINNSDGSVNIDGSVISYTGLEPITDNMVVANRVFTFTGAAETISLTDSGGADNMTRIDSSLGEFVDFVTPTATLTINTNGGDTTTITSFDAAFNTPIMTFADSSGTTSTFNLAAANIIPDVTGLVLTGNVNFNLNNFNEQIASLASTNATPVVTLSAGRTLTVGDATNTVYSGTLVSSGALTKVGTGNLTLSGGNTYTGATTVNQGTLTITQVGPGSANANIGAGVNTQLTTSLISVASGAVVNFNTGANFSSSNTGTTLNGAGTIRLSSGVWWMGNPAGGTIVSMAVGGLIDVQGGTLKNDYSNANWTANQASLNVNTGATFNLRNNNVNIDSLTGTGAVINDFATNTLTMGVANGTGATFSGTMGPGGTSILVVKNGTGTQTLSGANINYAGATTVNNGELILFNSTGYNSPTTVNNGAKLTFSGNANMQNNNTGDTILLNNGATLQNTNPNNWTVINGAVTVPAGASATINHISNATGSAGRGFYLDGGLKGTGSVTINATNAGSGVNFRNNNTTFAGTMIVNGIASTTPFAGSGIGVGGNTSGLTNADIQLNGTMELLNQGIGWANGAPGDFFMGALSGNGVMVGNFTAGGQTRVRLGNNNNSGVFNGTIANGAGNTIVLTKNGTGTQTLAGPGIVYTGATTVAAGTLKLSNTTAFASAMTVNAGATLNLANEFTTGSTGLSFGAAATINLNGGTLSYTSTNFANTWIVLNGAVTASAASTINIAPGNSSNVGLYFDGGLLGSATTTINATTPRAGANFRNNNTTFSGQLIVNGIASATAGVGSGIGVGGNTSGLINADIQLNGTMELLNQGIGWANTASGDFYMDALTGTGVMVGNFTAGGQTRVRLGNNNGSGVFSGQIVDGTGNQIVLTKNGTGTQTLSGTNTYTGTTTVAGGVLQLQNGNAIANGAGTVTVALGATLQLLTSETISAYVGNGDIGAGTNDSTLALGANVLTTTAGASIANVTSANGGIVAGSAIVDTDDDNNVTGTGIFLQAGTGVGTAVDPIETTISNLEALTATGGIFVTNTGALQIGNVTGTLGGVDVTTAGDIRLIATGSISVSLFNEDVVGPGNITIDAQGATSDVNTGTAGGFGSGSIVSTGAGALVSVSAGRNVNMGTATVNDYGDIYSAGNLLITAGQDFVIQQFTFLDVNSSGTGTVNAGRDIILFPDNTYSRISSRGGVLNLTAGRNISVGADGLSNTIDSTQAGAVPAGANINLTATTGSITLRDGINAGTAGTVTMTAGTNIVDTTPAGNTRVAGLNLVATATTGITGPLETAVTRLEASGGSGGVFVANTGNLTIGGIGPMVGVSATGGDIVVTTTGSLTVSENVAATGAGTDVTLTAIDAAAAGQNLIVNAGTLVSSAAASVTLNAGDDATITGNVTSGTTTTINVDFGDAETNGVGEVAVGSGGALNITGAITTPVVGSGGGAFLNGNDDFDTFSLNPQTTTEFRINGNPPANTVAGDILVMNVTGTANPNLTVPGTIAPYTGPGSGSWSFTSAHRPVLFTSIEDSTITGQYHLTYDNSVAPVGNLFVMRDAAQTRVQLRDGSTGGPVVYQGLLSVILSLRILGSGGNDIVTVDDINTLPDFAGTVPLVTDNGNLAGTAELLFDGLGGNDTLVYNVTGATASQSYAIGNGTGAAGLEGEVQTTAAGLTLQSYFQNVELTQRTGIGATPGGLVIIGDSSGNNITTAANGALTRTTATGYIPFEFSGNNYNAFTVNALAGPDIVDLVSLGSGQTNNFPITLNGNTEADTIRVRSTSGNTGLVTLNGNAGSDLFQLFDAGNTVDNIVGPVVVDGTDGNIGGNVDTLSIVDSGDGSADNVVVAAVNAGASQDYFVEGITSTAGSDVIFRNVDVLNYVATQDNDSIDGRFVNTAPAHDLNSVSLSGWTGADQFLLFLSDQIGGSGPNNTPTGVASGLNDVNLFGDALGNPNAGDGNDIFGATPAGLVGTGVTNVGLVVPDTTRMIRPSTTTSIAIDGGQPTGLAAPLGDVVGDVNNVDVSALPNTTPVVVSTFSPGTVVAAGIQPLTWTQIEDINLVDQGKLTNVQMGDLFARTTPGADLIQLTRNPTPLNPNQVRLRITATIGNYSVSNKTIMYGGGHNDTLTQANLTIPAEFYGEAGDDYLSGAMNNDWLVGGDGNDRINGSGGDNVIWGDNAPTVPGDLTPQNSATGGDDQLSGLGGNDVFYGSGGNDLVSAGGGNDYANGGFGNDTIGGHDGDDRLYGGAGNDVIGGGTGNDLLSGGDGNDQLIGNAGNDVIFGGTGNDLLDGGDGNDLLVSGSVANENSTWTSVANTTTYSAATYTNASDNDAALLTLLSQWGSASNRSSIGAITHDGANDDLAGGTGDDDFCWETADIVDNFPSLSPNDFNAMGMGTDERFGPT